MYRTTLLPHTADIRLKVEAGTIAELFEGALAGMGNILSENFCTQSQQHDVVAHVDITAIDITALLIDFLSEVLTLSYVHKAVFCKIQDIVVGGNRINATVRGMRVGGFDEDIKAVTYHEAEVREHKDGRWETMIIFDI